MKPAPTLTPIKGFWYGLGVGFCITHCVVLVEMILIQAWKPAIGFIALAVGFVAFRMLWALSEGQAARRAEYLASKTKGPSQ